MLVILEPFVHLDAQFLLRRFGFALVIANSNNKIWFFAATGLDVEVIKDHQQFLHLRLALGLWKRNFYASLCMRNVTETKEDNSGRN